AAFQAQGALEKGSFLKHALTGPGTAKAHHAVFTGGEVQAQGSELQNLNGLVSGIPNPAPADKDIAAGIEGVEKVDFQAGGFVAQGNAQGLCLVFRLGSRRGE